MTDRAGSRRAHRAGPCQARIRKRAGGNAVVRHHAGAGHARGRKTADAAGARAKGGHLAGFTSIKSAKAGLYTISLSTGAWVDVVQDGHALKPVAFSGATDCSGIRKTVKYELSAQPFVLQVSGAKENSVSIAILPTQ